MVILKWKISYKANYLQANIVQNVHKAFIDSKLFNRFGFKFFLFCSLLSYNTTINIYLS